MVDLSTSYLALKLANPLVPSASPLSRSLDTARQLEDAGAAAIVMYSLFEEQLRHDEETAARFLIEQETGHAEAHSFLPVHASYVGALDQHLEQLAALKRTLNIPVIASLNGVSLSGWVEHGRQLQDAGADALELNVYYVAADPSQSGNDVEARYLELLRELRRQVYLPITMKLSTQFSSIPHFIKRLEEAGAAGVALFNRFYQPNLDPETGQVTPHLQLSTSADSLFAMRWIAILCGRVELSLAATGGIHTAEDALKMLRAGADVTHLCSALLTHGPHWLGEVKKEMERWLEEHEYESIADIKGTACQARAADAAAFERANYVWVLDSYTPSSGVRR
jgi:dihydroorotate dehydrogenase (fumarate)